MPSRNPRVRKLSLKRETIRRITAPMRRRAGERPAAVLRGVGVNATQNHTCTCAYGATLEQACPQAKWFFTVSCHQDCEGAGGNWSAVTCNGACVTWECEF